MKTSILRKNQKGFTLIEIIAVLVILGILAAVAIPKYLDMRKDAVIKAAGAAMSELNARERLGLAQWKLKGGDGPYPGPGTSNTAGGDTVTGVSTDLGADWSGSYASDKLTVSNFNGKEVGFTRHAPTDTTNEPYYWTVSVAN